MELNLKLLNLTFFFFFFSSNSQKSYERGEVVQGGGGVTILGDVTLRDTVQWAQWGQVDG